ncbi:hypothetical protein ACKX2L_11180 [Lachnospiraceae bacterium YH-ros2228]
MGKKNQNRREDRRRSGLSKGTAAAAGVALGGAILYTQGNMVYAEEMQSKFENSQEALEPASESASESVLPSSENSLRGGSRVH